LIAAVVTQRRQTQSALIESEGRVSTLLDATGDGLLVLDPNGRVRHANKRFAEMWRIDQSVWESPESGIALLREMQARIEDQPDFMDMMTKESAPGESSMEKITLRDGSVFHQFSVPCPEQAGLAGRVWSYRDVTAIEEGEAERLRLERQIQHAQKLKSLGLLAGGIAHDFNNLLLAVLGYADLSLDALPEDSEVRPYLSHIVTATQRASGLSKQMLAYSGRGTYVVEPIDLVATVRETSGLLECSISKRAKLVYDFAPELPQILGDGVQVHQIVMNLVTNASDALQGEDGRIHVSVGVAEFDRGYLSTCYVDDNLPAGTYVYLEVADTGVGMDAEIRSKIFDPFFTSKGTGRGLGLAAALGIIRGHKGAVRVESNPGGGSIFRVMFPASDEKPATMVPPVLDEKQWLGRGKVLVVDDEEVVRELARRILQGVGFDVVEAVDGLDAVEVFHRHAGELDLVLLDMTMPGLDGANVLGEMQRMDPRVPVILTSGYTETEMVERVTDSAFAGFLQKPYRRTTLVTMTREVLRRNTGRSMFNAEVAG
jgi:signal transduction histidine kinase/CheY-like chemotaxis protein